MKKDRVGLARMAHVFMDAEGRRPEVEVQGCAHAHRRQVKLEWRSQIAPGWVTASERQRQG